MSELSIGGVAASELARTYGTPLLALDLDVLDRSIAEFVYACEPHGIEIAYAGKALLLVALAEHLKSTPLTLDVCSLGELLTAQRAGFPAERITFHGCGKSGEELDAAAQGMAARIVVDNVEELRALSARANARAAAVLLRINTGVEAQTHAFVRTAGVHSKFGFGPFGLAEALALIAAAPPLRFAGLHAHIGSQIFEMEAFCASAAALMDCAAACARTGHAVPGLIVGGGFGVRMPSESGERLDPAATMAAIGRTVAEAARRLEIPQPRIGIEPGRALIAAAGTTLYTVVAVKREFERAYAIVDGGIFENPRPALYGAAYDVVCAAREPGETVETIVCGRSCENDELATARLPRDLRAGDLLAVPMTGAYTFSMASNYNRFARPAVVTARGGAHALAARRESVQDVLARDCRA